MPLLAVLERPSHAKVVQETHSSLNKQRYQWLKGMKSKGLNRATAFTSKEKFDPGKHAKRNIQHPLIPEIARPVAPEASHRLSNLVSKRELSATSDHYLIKVNNNIITSNNIMKSQQNTNK